MDNDDPSYDELLEENYELHEEVKTITHRLQTLEQDLATARTSTREHDCRAAELERLQNVASAALADVAERNQEIEQLKHEREKLTRTQGRLEAAIKEKEDRSLTFKLT